MSEDEKKIEAPYIRKETINLKSMADGRTYVSRSEYDKDLKNRGMVIADNDYIQDVKKNAADIHRKEDNLTKEYLNTLYDIRTQSGSERQYQANVERFSREFEQKYERDFAKSRDFERHRQIAREAQIRRLEEQHKRKK